MPTASVFRRARRRVASGFAACLAISAAFPALAAAPQSRPASAASAPAASRLKFAPPEIYKVGKRSVFVQAGDLNGDGRRDLVCVDNEKNLFYFLYQEKPGIERRFRIVEEPAQSLVTSLAAGDFNGDGRADLAIGGDQAAIRYQDEHGVLGDPQELHEKGLTVLAVDLNGDKRDDLVLANPDETLCLLQKPTGQLADPARRAHTFKSNWPPICYDIDGDGRRDLVYRNFPGSDRLYVCLQTPAGSFDSEIAFKAGGYIFSLAAGNFGAGGPGFAAVEQNTGAMKVLRLRPKPGVKSAEPVFSLPRMMAYSDEKQGSKSRIAALDVAGHGASELLILTEDRPAFGVVRSGAGGSLARDSAPGLLGSLKARVSLSPDKSRRILWLLSRKEQTVGAAEVAEGKIGLPQPLELGAAPLVFDLADIDRSGAMDLVFAAKTQDKARLIILHDVDPKNPAKAKRTEIDLSAMGVKAFNDFSALEMVVADVNRDRRPDVVIFPEYGDLEILLQTETGGFKPFLSGGGVKKGLFEGVRPAQFHAADLNGDGLNELLVAKSNFARVLSIEPDGRLTVLQQLSGKLGKSEIAAVSSGDVDGGGKREAALLDKALKIVTLYRPGKTGAYELLAHVDIDPVAGSTLQLADMNGDGKDDLIVGADEQFGVVFSGRNDPTLQRAALWRTQVDDGAYRLTAAADLIPGGGDEIAALENREHLLEFYQLGADDKPDLIYKFKVFGGEGEREFYDPDKPLPPEPRELLFDDLDGDGARDLAALVHDHVIVYAQTPAPASAPATRAARAGSALPDGQTARPSQIAGGKPETGSNGAEIRSDR